MKRDFARDFPCPENFQSRLPGFKFFGIFPVVFNSRENFWKYTGNPESYQGFRELLISRIRGNYFFPKTIFSGNPESRIQKFPGNSWNGKFLAESIARSLEIYFLKWKEILPGISHPQKIFHLDSRDSNFSELFPSFFNSRGKFSRILRILEILLEIL